MKEEAGGSTSAYATAAEDQRLRAEQLLEKGSGNQPFFNAEPHTVTSPSAPGRVRPRWDTTSPVRLEPGAQADPVPPNPVALISPPENASALAPHRCGPHGAEVRVVGDSSLTPSAAERPRRLPLPRGSRRIAEVFTHSLMERVQGSPIKVRSNTPSAIRDLVWVGKELLDLPE
jgi:hypothetical protein